MDRTVPSSHPWRSSGEKRTIWWHCDPSYQIIQYLKDMQEAIHYGILMGEELRRRNGRMPSPIDLRREIKPWFDSSYGYAKHHINPVCRSSIAILRSFRKNRKRKKYPEVRKLSMRMDSELVKLQDGFIRTLVKPPIIIRAAINPNPIVIHSLSLRLRELPCPELSIPDACQAGPFSSSSHISHHQVGGPSFSSVLKRNPQPLSPDNLMNQYS